MSQAHNRITAYHWYLGSAFWRERREHIIHSDCQKAHELAIRRVSSTRPLAPRLRLDLLDQLRLDQQNRIADRGICSWRPSTRIGSQKPVTPVPRPQSSVLLPAKKPDFATNNHSAS